MKTTLGMNCARIIVVLGILGVLAGAGCSDDSHVTAPSPEVSVFVEKISGDDQVGETGRELPERIVVRVYDAEGSGIEGATVAFEVTGGGGTVSASSVATDPDGMASVRWTLGAPPVWNRLRASAAGYCIARWKIQ